jgi:hypothetical protein
VPDNAARIADRTKLPILVKGYLGDQLVWPPEQISTGIAYTQMVSEMVRGPAMAPQTEQQRADAAARHIAHGQALERDHERANAEASRRAAEELAERQRTAAGR